MKPLTPPWPAFKTCPVKSIESFYTRAQRLNDGFTGAHLDRLRTLATGLDLCVEFGVRRGSSSSALLLGAQRVMSFDIQPTPEAQQLKAFAGDRWDYRLESSLAVAIPTCDLLFIDSLHTYLQCDAELKQHAGQVSKYLVFHDSIWRGSWGEGVKDMKDTRHADRELREKALGIRPAIDALMIRDRSWFIAAHYTDNCGLLVLERRP